MRKLFKEKYVVVYLFSVTLVFFFFAHRSTVKLQEEYLKGMSGVQQESSSEPAQFGQRLDSLTNDSAE